MDAEDTGAHLLGSGDQRATAECGWRAGRVTEVGDQLATGAASDQQPRPPLCAQKKRRDRLKAYARANSDWLLVDQDECWFSRFAQPDLQAWAAAGEALHLIARTPGRDEPNKALACYGARRQDTQAVLLYLCDGQPKSEYTWLMITRLLAVARQENKRVLAIIWDHASWHKSKRLKQWLRTYNQQAKRKGDVRVFILLLPKQSPWLNSIEPCWIHAKRKVCEPDGKLSVDELKRRLCAHFHTDVHTATLKLSALGMH